MKTQFGWWHHCGHLNTGAWRPGETCGGCRTETKREYEKYRVLIVPNEEEDR